MNEFIIVFRETLEASLIVGIIYTILIKNELYESYKKLWIGAAVVVIIFAWVLWSGQPAPEVQG